MFVISYLIIKSVFKIEITKKIILTLPLMP